jgi:MFS family permease
MQLDTRLLAVALAGFCTFLDLYATQSLLPFFRQVFHVSEVEVSLTVSATTIAVALTAPLVGLLADLWGRKWIIVPAILGLSVPTLLAATSSGLHELIGWRFLQGLFMPGIFAVTIAYISEEWAGVGVGKAMAAYVTGNVIGGFCGRFISGVVAQHLGWRWAFVVLGCLNLAGGAATWAWLPRARRFIPAKGFWISLFTLGNHLRNPHLLAAYAVGFNILFSLVGTFTYITFYLAAPPFHLGSVALGSIFFVYLLGVIVTPAAGKWIDRIGYRITLVAAITTSCLGVLLTLSSTLWMVILGLAICSSGIFVCQSAATSYVGAAAGKARSSAAGLYLSFYYVGGSVGGVLPGLFWSVGGWFACVALIVAVQLVTVGIALTFWRS